MNHTIAGWACGQRQGDPSNETARGSLPCTDWQF